MSRSTIRHLREGFNFLGCTIRHDPTPTSSRRGFKLLIKPSQASIQQMKGKLKGLWRTHVGSPTVALINAMNPVIRGWSHYFRIGVSKEVFTELDRFMYERTQRNVKWRHPRKSGWWRTQQDGGQTVGRQDRWVFQDKPRHGTLRKFAWTKFIRHRLVPTTYAPDDPTQQDYWAQRRSRAQTTAGRAGQLARRQQGLCPICHQALENGEDLHVHHVVP
jgi:RNA-directed DNA polymerase